MSSGFIPKALLQNSKIDPQDKIVYCALAGLLLETSEEALAPIVAARCGLTPKKARISLGNLYDLGWVGKDDNGYWPNLGPKKEKKESAFEEADRSAMRDIFDEKNRVVDNESINRVIKAFVDAGLNPAYNTKAAASKAYGSPWNRRSAGKLVDLYGIEDVEKMIEELGKRLDDTYRPLTKGLTELLNKWPNCLNFLKIANSKSGVVIQE